MKFGLKEENLKIIIGVFHSIPEVQEVILYGSRAMGTHQNASDIDLVLKGENLTNDKLNRINWLLDDLLLPYMIDLAVYNHIGNVDLIKHIERVGKVFYKRTEEKSESNHI